MAERSMKVILDTNIVISAILKDRTPEIIIRFVVGTPAWTWIASAAIVDEYCSVLRRPKFKLADTLIATWDSLFQQHIEIIEVSDTTDFSRDPKDAKFLQCLEAAPLALFVTGDRDFSTAPLHLHARIHTLTAFKSLIDAWVPEP